MTHDDPKQTLDCAILRRRDPADKQASNAIQFLRRRSVGKSVKPQFLAMLPGELQAVVQEAEQLAGCEIAVVPDAAANEFESLELSVDRRGVCSATIAYRGESISRCALLHELLHVKRYWLDAVPLLKATSRHRYDYEAQMVNDLIEHLTIIPEERRFAKAESNAHWSVMMANEFSRISSSSRQADVDDLRRSLLLQRAMVDIALPALDHTRLYDRLRDENLFEASTAFVDHLRNILNNKERALIVACKEFGYDLTGFCFGRFRLRTHPKSFERFASLAHSS